jgi:hypothetical protein
MWVNYYRKHKTFVKPKKMVKAKKLNDDHLDYIEICLKENPELTSRELCVKLQCVFGVALSISTMRSTRERLLWQSKHTRYCQTVRQANIKKRLDHTILCMKRNDNFSDVIFTDESTIKIQNSSRRTLYKTGHKSKLTGKPKHPWCGAGISCKGATDIHMEE